MKNPKIIISEGDVVGNKGAVAMVFGLVNGIRKKFPQAEFVITSKFIKDPNYLNDSKIKILYDNEQSFDFPLLKLWFWWLAKKIGINLKFLIEDKVLKTYRNADLVISASGISFHESLGFIKIYHFTKYIQIPFFLDKPVVKFTQSIGPFNSKYNKLMAKLTLPKIKYVFARGKHSESNLQKLNITNNVKVFPDIAMAMPSKENAELKNLIKNFAGKTIVGISPNVVCKNLDAKNNYIPSLKKLTAYILDKYSDVVLLFIPHTIEKEHLNKEDDYSICKELQENIEHKNRSEIINTLNLSPEETKYLISKCDFFIGSRFHSLIAAISSCVPSIAVGWHWKYEEMMEWLELENNVIQYWNLTEQKLLDMFELNFSNRKTIKEKMNSVVPEIQTKAEKAIEIINGLINEIN